MCANTADAVAELQAVEERIARLRSKLDADGIDESELHAVADACRSVESVLDRFEERATDWDDFQGYVEFRNELADTLESTPDSIPERDAFVQADGHVKTSGVSKSLNASDFTAAREALSPARRYAELRDDLEAARDARREARKRAQRRKRELRDRIDSLERLRELGKVDLDAPTDRLREPTDDYNERIEDAFEAFKRDAPAYELLAFIEEAAHTPFVEYEAPPAELLAYVRETAAGEYRVGELLEYADYSPSKLSHYVEDANLLKRRVATNRTYLERLSAEPIQLAWPPETAEELRFHLGELVSLVDRFADESTIATLREIRQLTRDEAYDRIRTAASADAELADEERRRIERGEVESDLRNAREELERIEAALADDSQ